MLQSAYQAGYNVNYRWYDINPRLMEIELPPQLVRFVSLLDSLKGKKYESSYALWYRLEKTFRKDRAYTDGHFSVGDPVVGRILEGDLWSLIVGIIKADPTYPTLPSMVLSPGGILYELDGVVVANQLRSLKGLWGWPSLICENVIPIKEFPALLENVLGDIPYKMAKEILG